MSDPEVQADSSQDSPGGCLLRIMWMFLGNFALVFSAAYIALHGESFFSTADLVFGSVVLLLIVVRYVDIKFLKGSTVFGEPASMRHWRRYVALLIGASIVIWAVAHAIAHLAK